MNNIDQADRQVRKELVSGTRTTSTYNDGNQLTLADEEGALTTYVYDGAGNRTERETASETTFYDWDSRNRLTVAEPPGGRVTYVYDADNQRVQKLALENLLYVWDGKQLVQKLDLATDELKGEYTFTTLEFGNLTSEYGEANHNRLMEELGL